MNSRLLAASLLLVAPACRGPAREPLITFFNADYGLSIRYPSSWRTEQAEQDGVWYRYFLAPPAGSKPTPAVSVTLLVGALEGDVDDYAQSYIAGNNVVASHDETRGSAKGRSFLFQSNDGATRHSLLLLKEDGRVYGLYAQGEAPLFEKNFQVLEEIARSFSFERAADYPELREPKWGLAFRVPPSWKETRSFSGGDNLLLQYRSPALAADGNRDPVHASLTLTVEPIRNAGGLDDYYEATRLKQGESFQLLSHAKWRGGYADQMRSETPVSVSRVKRYYRAAQGRGYSMTFEAREDVFPRVSRWCDLIAGTLTTGAEAKTP